jgi:alcohol dehydrogenase
MKAVILEEPHRLTYTDIDEAQQPGAGEVLVEVHRVGICGTDISAYLGKFPLYTYPRIPGHELGVEVLEIGPEVDNVNPGDRCSVEPYINNLNSFASRRGRGNCCDDLKVLGVQVDGGMRERFILPARKLHRSTTLTMDQLALVETLAIGSHGINRCQPHPGDIVLIIGAGPIGLSAVEFAKLTGAKVIVMDIDEKRLTFCSNTMKVHHTIVFRGDGSEIESVKEITSGNYPAIVIDVTGNSTSMSKAIHYVAHSGTLLYLGISNDMLSFPNKIIHAREISVLGSRNALPEDFIRIISLIEDGKIDTTPWITHRTALDELPRNFDKLIDPEQGGVKVIVDVK